jgi:hypothetical protein
MMLACASASSGEAIKTSASMSDKRMKPASIHGVDSDDATHRSQPASGCNSTLSPVQSVAVLEHLLGDTPALPSQQRGQRCSRSCLEWSTTSSKVFGQLSSPLPYVKDKGCPARGGSTYRRWRICRHGELCALTEIVSNTWKKGIQ